MKARFTINNLAFELMAETGIELFQQVAQIQEIFEAETKCGCCQSESLRYSFREVDSFKFYELTCRDCRAQFKFGQKKKDGALFPKRMDDDGRVLPHGGWSIYTKPDGTANPVRQNGPKPAANHVNGVADFLTWHDAEHSDHWGDKWIRVEGNLYKLSEDGTKYQKQLPASKTA